MNVLLKQAPHLKYDVAPCINPLKTHIMGGLAPRLWKACRVAVVSCGPRVDVLPEIEADGVVQRLEPAASILGDHFF